MVTSDEPIKLNSPTLFSMLIAALKVSMLSVGGGVSAWMFREFVTRLRWIDESDFLNDLAVARILPGTNITNLTVIMGFRLLGAKGAAVGFIGLLVGPFCLLMLLLYFYDSLQGPVLDTVLQGAAAGAIGPVALLTYRGIKHGANRWYTALVLLAVSIAAILKFPLVLIVCIALPLSVGLTWLFWKA